MVAQVLSYDNILRSRPAFQAKSLLQKGCPYLDVWLMAAYYGPFATSLRTYNGLNMSYSRHKVYGYQNMCWSSDLILDLQKLALMFSGSSRLPREEIAQNARWLVHQTTWGYLTTLDAHTKAWQSLLRRWSADVQNAKLDVWRWASKN